MRQLILQTIIILISLFSFGQQDTVFIKLNIDPYSEIIKYETDTIIFSSVMYRHLLKGTCVLPNTHGQMNASGFGISLDKVIKSDCQKGGEEVYRSEDKINSIINTDTSLIVDFNIYDNCCYDFLCDISVDSLGTLNIIYQGYGTYCACDCCFGLTFFMSKSKSDLFGELKAVVLSRNQKTMKIIK